MGRFSSGWITYGSANFCSCSKCIQSMFCMLILHILHINTKYAEQNRALLDTLRIHQSNNNQGHIVLYATLLIEHTQHKGHMRVSSWPLGNCSRPIARTCCLSARLGYLMGRFSPGWITYGSANFCSCSKCIQGSKSRGQETPRDSGLN